MGKCETILCPVCGNDVKVNLKYKYHKCLACGGKIRLTMSKNNHRILRVEENVEWSK